MVPIGNEIVLTEQEYMDSIACLKRMKVPQVKDVARALSLPLSGKKQDLIDRVSYLFEQSRFKRENTKELAIRTIILKVFNNDPVPNFVVLYNALQTGAFNYTDGTNATTPIQIQSILTESNLRGNVNGGEQTSDKRFWLKFKESPFYKLKQMVHGGPQVAYASKMKAVCRYNFVLNEKETELLRHDKRLQLYLMCGASNAPDKEALLQFPIPMELHVNGTHVKENVRGIKGKPGTARPANLSKYILPRPQRNKIELAYAGSNENFLLYLYIVLPITSDEIMKRIESQPHIHKDSTIADIKKEYYNEAEGADDDIIVSTTTISLKCPLSYVRIRYPVKSMYCRHLQCFDGLSYLHLQEQVPTWTCPICSDKIDLSHLAVSDYYQEILNNTSKNIENVTINEDGSWHVVDGTHDSDSDSSDDFDSQKPVYTNNESNRGSSSHQPETVEVISLDSDSENDAEASNTSHHASMGRLSNGDDGSNSESQHSKRQRLDNDSQPHFLSYQGQLQNEGNEISTSGTEKSALRSDIENNPKEFNSLPNINKFILPPISIPRAIGDADGLNTLMSSPNRGEGVDSVNAMSGNSDVGDANVLDSTIMANIFDDRSISRNGLAPSYSRHETVSNSPFHHDLSYLPLSSNFYEENPPRGSSPTSELLMLPNLIRPSYSSLRAPFNSANDNLPIVFSFPFDPNVGQEATSSTPSTKEQSTSDFQKNSSEDR